MKTICRMAIFIICLVFSGCATYDLKSFYSDQTIDNKIPPLEIEKKFGVKLESGPKTYFYEHNSMTGQTTFHEAGFKWTNEDKTYSNRIEDAFKIVDKEFENNICENFVDKFYGKVTCIIINDDNTANGWWLIPSVASLFTINFLGFPVASQSTDVEVYLQIYDCEDNLVSKYSASGEGIAYSAMYWGYSAIGAGRTVGDDMSISRAAHVKAVVSALEKIKEQIKNDALIIRQRLITAYKKQCGQ